MSRLSEGEFIGLLYDAALERVAWPDAVSAMARVLSGETSNLVVTDAVTEAVDILGMHATSEDFVELYGSTFFEHDLWRNEALRRNHYGATLGAELVSDAEWERSLIYNEFLKSRTDAFHLVGSLVHLNGGSVLAVGCHRPSTSKAFSPDDQAKLNRLLPHLKRSAEMHQRLARTKAQAEGSRQALDRTNVAVVQLDVRGRVVQSTASAERILAAGDGLARAAGSIHAQSRHEDAALQALIAGAVATTSGNGPGRSAGGYLRISRPSRRRPYGVLVAPLGLDREVLFPSHPAVLLFLTDPDDGASIDTAALCELYALSPAEARIVAAIAMGGTLRDIAVRLDVSINTVKTLLARAMAKTETNSQIGLVRLVLLGPAGGNGRPD